MRVHGLGVGLALLLSGCGAFSGNGSGATNSYIGSWLYFSGTESQTCDDGTAPTMPLQGNALTITQGASSSELVVQEGPCQVTFVIGSSGATLTHEQECTFSGTGSNSGGTFTYTANISFTQSSLVYNNDSDLRIAQADRRILQYPGKRLDCEVNTNGSLQKLNGRE
ncbi:MAG TPA: hypothetical protein VH877_06530 [Polyangia bacterium]|jgi:hypothetical protein|nr:hypothetical protein [Polyangia bacterium]